MVLTIWKTLHHSKRYSNFLGGFLLHFVNTVNPHLLWGIEGPFKYHKDYTKSRGGNFLMDISKNIFKNYFANEEFLRGIWNYLQGKHSKIRIFPFTVILLFILTWALALQSVTVKAVDCLHCDFHYTFLFLRHNLFS